MIVYCGMEKIYVIVQAETMVLMHYAFFTDPANAQFVIDNTCRRDMNCIVHQLKW